MNYELAAKLKAAGFPQGLTEHQYGWVEASQAFELDSGDMSVGISVPILEELIEACPNFRYVGKNGFGVHSENEEWVAQAQWGTKAAESLNAYGANALEAVANLYLALKSK